MRQIRRACVILGLILACVAFCQWAGAATFLEQSTAHTARFGPFVDDSDGVTAETGLTVNQADIQISKAGGAFAQTSDASPSVSHDADGWYSIPLTATDTGTVGALTVQLTISGALPVWREFIVVPSNVYDSFVGGTDNLEVDAVAISASTGAADNVESNIGNLDAAVSTRSTFDDTSDTVTVGTNNDKTGYSLTQPFPTNFADLAITSSTGLVSVGTNNDKSGYSISGTKQTLDALNDLTAAQVNTEVDTAFTDYDPSTNTEMTAAFTEIKGATWATTDTLEAIRDRGDAAWVTATGFSTHDAAAVRTEIDSNSTQLAAIVSDTGELQTDWADGGRLDLILDARASQSSVDGLNDVSTAQVNTEMGTALADIHLDHLLAADYDPASKPGVVTALLNELVENDGGVARYTTNALEQAPGGGNVTVGAFTQAALAEMITDDTGETTAAAGSVAKIAQGAAGGNVTVGDLTTAALAKFATQDTGETVAVSGSVAALSQEVRGDGDTEVNHDTLADDGGNMVYESSPGTGIDDGVVTAYLESEYAASNFTVRGRTYTDSNGEWVAPLYLNSGSQYRIVFEHPSYETTSKTVTVP